VAEDGDTLVILLCGGDKDTQRRDIAKAKAYWQAYLEAKASQETREGEA
jgi:putative addiction module killer protein